MARGHTHTCRSCGEDFPCNAPLERNYDGFPEVVCAWEMTLTEKPECEVCAHLPRCDWCGNSIDVEPFTDKGLTYCSRLCWEDCEEHLRQAVCQKWRERLADWLLSVGGIRRI